ncbi:hypothetical protein BU16DRAFT_619993 [Lophium mytilinum]|uniref:DUF6604 domain-containing protein n=1 Tax=Lophium mytilinum TaxID=390894 RepID=A0A6A6QLK9_9PEZI|nr:hypothetical protein BU16DRAFT_619993 [Lophium mytilinum]
MASQTKTAPTTPQNLFHMYTQYKSDTEKIGGWLAETSKKCGYATEMLSEGPSEGQHPATSTRLKGKTRKLAREAAKQSTHEDHDSAAAQYKIKVSDFIPMAQIIASKKPSIPAILRRLFSRAITARRKCADWFGQHSEQEKDSNRKHMYFISILEETFRLLLPLVATSKYTDTTSGPTKATPSAQTTSTMFENLTVEDTIEHSDSDNTTEKGIDAASSSTESPMPRAQIERDEEEVKAEFLFAIQCFLAGLKELRTYLGRGWKNYKAGFGELLIAAITTNTAVALVRLSEREFENSITRPKDYPLSKYPTWCLPCVLFFENLRNRADLPKDHIILPSDFQGDPSKPVRLEEITMFKVYTLLKNYVPSENEPRGRFSIPAGYAWLLRDAGEDPRIIRLAEFLPEFCKIAGTSPCRFAEDEFSYGMRHLLLNREVPIWLTFAAQMFVDIQEILGHESRQHLDDIQDTVRQALTWHEGHTTYFEESGTYQKKKSKELDALNANINWFRAYVLEDRFGVEKGLPSVLPGEVNSGLDPSTEHYYLRSNPLRCGLLKYYVLMQRHHKGHYMAGEQMHVMSMAHLYAACRILHPESPKWPDMELLIARQTPEYLFFGGWPKTLQDSETKFLFMIGMPANGTAKGRRNTSFKLQKVRRLAKGQSLFFGILNERAGGNWDNVDRDTAKLREMFRDDQVWKHMATQTHSRHKPIPSRKQWQNTPSLSDFAACVWLRCGLSYEAADFCFDWLSMHRTCEGIFRAFGEAPAVGGTYPGGHPGETTFFILSQTGRTENTTFGKSSKNVKKDRSAPLLNVVFNLIQDVCKRGDGDKEIRSLRGFSYDGRTDYGNDLWKLEALSPLYGGDDLVPKHLYEQPALSHQTAIGQGSTQSQPVEEEGLVQGTLQRSVSAPGRLSESHVRAGGGQARLCDEA